MNNEQLAKSLALVLTADLEDQSQTLAAINLFRHVVPEMRNRLLADVELAADASRAETAQSIADALMAQLFPVETAEEEDLIPADDGVGDSEDDNEPDEEHQTLADLAASVATIKAAAEVAINHRGSFLPLDNLNVVDGVGDEDEPEEDSTEKAAAPRSSKPEDKSAKNDRTR